MGDRGVGVHQTGEGLYGNAGDTWDTPCSDTQILLSSVANLEHNQSPEICKNLIFLMLLIQSRHVMVTAQTRSFCHSRVQV